MLQQSLATMLPLRRTPYGCSSLHSTTWFALICTVLQSTVQIADILWLSMTSTDRHQILWEKSEFADAAKHMNYGSELDTMQPLFRNMSYTMAGLGFVIISHMVHNRLTSSGIH